jgi:hypothetical protein
MARAASRALFSGLLDRDRRTTQDDIMEQARELEKQQKRMGQFGSIGSLLGSLAAAALVPATGGASLALMPLLAKGAGSAVGSYAGEKLAGSMYDVDIKASDTGLLGSQFDTLQDLETDANKGIGGRSLGRGATTMLYSGGADYLKDFAGFDVLAANAGDATDPFADYMGFGPEASWSGFQNGGSVPNSQGDLLQNPMIMKLLESLFAQQQALNQNRGLLPRLDRRR